MGSDNTNTQNAASSPRKRARLVWFSGYPLVLILIGASYWVTALQETHDPRAIALLLQLLTVTVVFRTVRVRRAVQQASWWVLGIGLIAILGVLVFVPTNQTLDAVLATAATVAYLIAPIVVLSTELHRQKTDRQTLFAAVCSYILIGMFFTYFYHSIALWSADAVFQGGQTDELANLLFFSFTTLTTTGYGNLIPATAGVQGIAIAEAITGQLFLVIAVAHVVSGWSRTLRSPDHKPHA